MTTAAKNGHAEPPPYFDTLFDQLSCNDPVTTVAYGRHVHWGYWPNPATADQTPTDYAWAAELLCRRVCDAAGIKNGLRILDVGCGFGGTLASLNERYHNLDMVGVNIDSRQLERAASEFRPLNGNQASWVKADAGRLPFANASFDVVLAVECIFHFDDRSAFFAEASRVLRPDGRLALSDFVPPADMIPYIKCRSATADVAMERTYGRIDIAFTRDDYSALAATTGFSMTHAEDITPHIMPTYRFLRGCLFPNNGKPDEVILQQTATRRLEKLCGSGALTYSVLAFTRAG